MEVEYRPVHSQVAQNSPYFHFTFPLSTSPLGYNLKIFAALGYNVPPLHKPIFVSSLG
jgi:hypothetical protein